ncbi:Uncharacterised protein [Escherichia coli]|nr:Uncharacterised protein [Escherichia coli]
MNFDFVNYRPEVSVSAGVYCECFGLGGADSDHLGCVQID